MLKTAFIFSQDWVEGERKGWLALPLRGPWDPEPFEMLPYQGGQYKFIFVAYTHTRMHA